MKIAGNEVTKEEDPDLYKEPPYCCNCGMPIVEKSVCIDGDWYCSECEDIAWKEIRREYLQDPE